MIGLYLRVSTKLQELGYSLELQEEDGCRLARGQREDYRIYSEAKSGKRLDIRTEWKRLEADVQAGLVNKVWAGKGDRLGRNMGESLRMVATLIEKGVPLYLGDKLIDFNNPNDVLFFHVGQAIAEYEGKTIVQRTTNGIHASINSGNWANPIYGYKITGYEQNGGGKARAIWSVVNEQAETIKRVFDLFLRGGSMRQIAFTLNREGRRPHGRHFHGVFQVGEFHPGHIHRILRNPRYVGMIRNVKKEFVSSTVYRPIVTQETWKAAQRRLKLFPSVPWKQRARHMATGILRCSECGAPYHHSGKVRKYPSGETAFQSCYLHFANGKPCGQHPKLISGEVIDEMFAVAYLVAMQDRRSVERLHEKELVRIDREAEAVRLDVERIDRLIAEAEMKKSRLLKSIEDGIDAKLIAPNMSLLSSEIERLSTSRVGKMKDINLRKERSEAMLTEFAVDNVERFVNATPRDRHNMLERVVKSARMKASTVTVSFVSGAVRKFQYRPNAHYLDRSDPDTLDSAFWEEFGKAKDPDSSIEQGKPARDGKRHGKGTPEFTGASHKRLGGGSTGSQRR